VYGELPSNDAFPLSVGQTWMLYNNALIQSRVQKLPLTSTCPSQECGMYSENNFYQPTSVSWIWHSYPYTAVSPNTWAEVIHEQDPFGDEGNGAWFMYARGSGIWFNTGATIVFNEHNDAYAHFQVRNPADGQWNSAMSRAAAKAGYDSVQFMKHIDHTNYQCDTHNTGRSGFMYLSFELVGVKLVGTYACGSQYDTIPAIRRGWQASQPCLCKNKLQFLNCHGVPGLSKDNLAFASNVSEFVV
jgi:hypothetical protein